MESRIPKYSLVASHAQDGTRRSMHLDEQFPKVVTLCGSTRFKELFIQINKILTMKGHIVLSVGMFGHSELSSEEMKGGEIKKNLDTLHFRKIELGDCIFVIDGPRKYCTKCQEYKEPLSTYPWMCPKAGIDHTIELRPYIGESTNNEIAYAQALKKNVFYLSSFIRKSNKNLSSFHHEKSPLSQSESPSESPFLSFHHLLMLNLQDIGIDIKE